MRVAKVKHQLPDTRFTSINPALGYARTRVYLFWSLLGIPSAIISCQEIAHLGISSLAIFVCICVTGDFRLPSQVKLRESINSNNVDITKISSILSQIEEWNKNGMNIKDDYPISASDEVYSMSTPCNMYFPCL